jgi:HprK-related kinase A
VKVGDLPRSELVRRLRREGVHLNTGAFTTHVRIAFPRLAEEFAEMYAQYPLDEPPGIDDARVRVVLESGFFRLGRRMAIATTDTDAMEPVPVERAFTAMETALNWGAASSDVAPLIMHSAVLERDGRALIMPAPSGSGKSTLAAALAWRGWRLFSDELAVFSFEDGSLYPNPRPVSLKNRAVDVIAAFEPRASFSRLFRGTLKGDVAYMQPPADAIARADEPALAGLVIAPMYAEGAATTVRVVDRADGFRGLVDSTLNYASMLRPGFEMLTGVVDRCGVYSLTYSDLDSAIEAIDRLHAQGPESRGAA